MTGLDAMKAMAATECRAAAIRDRMNYRPGGVPSDLLGKPAVSRVDTKAREVGRVVRDAVSLSKQDIITKAKLTPTTINNVLDRAKDMGLVHYSGRVDDVWRFGPKPLGGRA